MGETGVADVRGGEAELTSDEATWLLVATDASGALEVVFLNIFGLRISKICCLWGAAGRLRPPFGSEFDLWLVVPGSFLGVTFVAASFCAAVRICSASDSEIVLLWLLTAMLSWSQIANSSLLSKFNSFDNS
jgi:hypothetical protein